MDAIAAQNRKLWLGGILGATAFVSLLSIPAWNLAAGEEGMARTIVNLLADRSPGARGEANLRLTKERVAPEHRSPSDEITERALGKVFPGIAPVGGEGFTEAPVFMGALGPEALGFSPVSISTLPSSDLPTSASVPGGIGSFSPGGGGAAGGGISGPGGTGGSEITTPLPAVVPAAVPEPGTWLTMIFGFVACAWFLRRRQPVAKSLSSG